MPQCSAFGCTMKGDHRFLLNEELKRKWEIALRRERFSSTSSSRVCSAHFNPEDYETEAGFYSVEEWNTFPEAITMNPEMLLLVERLVVAMENVSQDVRNIAAYMYDFSYSVSHFLNVKKEKEVISFEPHDGDYFPSDTSAAGSEYSWPYEEGDGSSASQTDNREHEKSSVGDVASVSVDHNEACDGFPSTSKPTLTGEKKTQEGSKKEENTHYMIHNTSGDERNEGTAVTEEDNNKISINEDCFPLREENRVSLPMATAASEDCTTYMTRHPGEESSGTKTPKVECAPEFDVGEAFFQCPLCNNTCFTASNFVEHMRMHSEERHYKCFICTKAFEERGDLEKHMLLHSGEKPHKCRECGKAFTHSCFLIAHLRSHTGEKPFKCTVCGKAFSLSGNLTVHMRSHTGQRPFRCTVCGKAFTQNANLTVHMRSHTGEKPFICIVCGKAFSQRGNLHSHMFTHST